MSQNPDWTPSRLVAARALFERVLDANPSDVAAFLQQVSPHEADLHRDVLALLAAHAETGATLHSPISGQILAAIPTEVNRTGTMIGPYHIGREIGAGGMGVVFEATRSDDGTEKRVALKFLRRSVESDLAIRRFRHERQILANLSHPNIGALLDGGVTRDQQPYFVMEYIDGQPVTEWCDARTLPLRGRLLIFRQVCQAVQHAHQNLVIHRDLKPGNILVTVDGTVKLLDFGIAKLLRLPEGEEYFPPTQGGARVFTPEYASPEQTRGLPAGVASDVYALGVLLFELVTGRRPFALHDKLIVEIERIVCSSPPPKPSAVLGADRWRRVGARSGPALHRRVVGELDAIILKALRKEPENRYGSVDEFARDVEAYLDHRPVRARSERWSYRATKWLRRHPVEALASSLLLLSLLGGMLLSTRQTRLADAERDRANAITEFFTTMLAAPDPGRLGRTVMMREVLDSASLRAVTLDHDPALAAEVREILGDSYRELHTPDAARREYRRAIQLRTSLAAADALPTGRLLLKLGDLAWRMGDNATANNVLDSAARVIDGHSGSTHPLRDSLRRVLADFDAAEGRRPDESPR